MKTRLRKLWQWLTRGDPWTPLVLVPLILSFLIGSYVFLRILGFALMSDSSDSISFEIGLGGFGGAFATGFACGFVHPRQPLLWSTGFTWPLILWGLFCLPFALFEGPGLLIWLVAALMMAAIAIFASLLARRFRQWLAAT